MTSLFRPMFCAAMCTATLLAAATPAGALPSVSVGSARVAPGESTSLLEPVQYRGQYGGRRYHQYSGNRYSGNRGRGNGGRNLALGIGGLIIGGIVLSEAARSQHRQEHGSDWQRCAQTYRSFEPDTGMYTGYDGQRQTCPYLR